MPTPTATAPTSKRPLMPHQQDALRWLTTDSVRHPAWLMDMRLGKSLTAIRTVQGWYPTPTTTPMPILVLAPLTVLNAWRLELTEERETFILSTGLSPEKRRFRMQWAFKPTAYRPPSRPIHPATPLYQRRWVLLNYEALRADPTIAAMAWKVVIADESTTFRNPSAQISKVMTKGFRMVPHRMILSGLPSPESDLDLFQQFKFLHNTFLGCDNYYHFRAKFYEPANGVDSRDGWDPKPDTRQTIHDAVHSKAFVLRRQDVNLPNHKVRETYTIPPTPEQLKQYRMIEREFATLVTEHANHTIAATTQHNPAQPPPPAILDLPDSDSEITADNHNTPATTRHETDTVRHETQHVIVKQLWLARLAGGCDIEGNLLYPGKRNELYRLLTGELQGQPVVVYFRFNSELRHVAELLNANNIPNDILVGSTPTKERSAILEWFQSPASPPNRVLLCQVALVKMGLNLSAADTIINYSRSYSCEVNAQSEDRIYHPKKTTPLLYIDLVTERTIDEDIVAAVNAKVTNAKLFMAAIDANFWRRQLNN